jgi:hypothetical protein
MKRLLLAIAAIMAITASGAAAARVNVDISIGGPDVILGGPDFILDGPDYYYPPVRYVRRPRVVIVPERVYRPVPVYRSRFYREDYRWRPDRRNFRHDFHGGPSHFHRGWGR